MVLYDLGGRCSLKAHLAEGRTDGHHHDLVHLSSYNAIYDIFLIGLFPLDFVHNIMGLRNGY